MDLHPLLGNKLVNNIRIFILKPQQQVDEEIIKKKVDKDKLFSLHSPWGGCENLYPFAAFSTHTKREIREIKNGDATFMKKLSSVSLFSQFDLNFLGETDVFNGKDIVNVFPK